MGKVVKFPVTPPKKLGARKARRSRKPDLEEFGQLNLFEPSKVVDFHQGANHFEKALSLDEKGDPRAVEMYHLAIDKKQSVADAYCNLGIIMSKQENLTKAIDYLTQCLRENPRHFEAHYNLANVYSDKGSFELAKMHYEVAIELEPDFPNSHYNLGLVHISMRQYREAINCIDRYINLSPEYDHDTAHDLLKTLTSIAQ